MRYIHQRFESFSLETHCRRNIGFVCVLAQMLDSSLLRPITIWPRSGNITSVMQHVELMFIAAGKPYTQMKPVLSCKVMIVISAAYAFKPCIHWVVSIKASQEGSGGTVFNTRKTDKIVYDTGHNEKTSACLKSCTFYR